MTNLLFHGYTLPRKTEVKREYQVKLRLFLFTRNVFSKQIANPGYAKSEKALLTYLL